MVDGEKNTVMEEKVAPEGVPPSADEGKKAIVNKEEVKLEKVEAKPEKKEEKADKKEEKKSDQKEEKVDGDDKKEEGEEKVDTEKKKDGKDDETTDKKKLEDYRTLGKPSKAKKSESAVKKVGSKAKKDDKKAVELERIYVVPMRRGFLKVPAYKRAKKAVKTLKEFLAKHMKVEERDLHKVKVDMYLNNEIWFRGIKKPLSKIKVRATKIDGIVYAELADVPEIVMFKKRKDEKRLGSVDKKQLDKVITQEAAEDKIKAGRENKADETETKEKEKATVEAGLEKNKEMATAAKHTAKAKSAKVDKMSGTTMRKALKK